MNYLRCLVSLLCVLAVTACTEPASTHTPLPAASPSPVPSLSPTQTPDPIERWPPPASWMLTDREHVPAYDPASTAYWQVDLRTARLDALDLSGSLDALMNGSFDTLTRWPPAERLPPGFDPRAILELGKDPGLGIRSLHRQGITGEGIGIAIIDQPLLVDHPEYASRLRWYVEATDVGRAEEATMHGGAVASIAVGQTCGVAPGAELYYFATYSCSDGRENDYTCLAEMIDRVMEFNQALPEGQKIRVISTEVGWNAQSKGYEAVMQSARQAKEAGLLVVSSSVGLVHGFQFHGMGREPLADPDQPASYGPGWFWANQFDAGERSADRLMIPMDSRTTAGPHGPEDYVFYRQGGWSWSIPWIAGLYALAAQVNPAITPDAFWSAAMKTAQRVEIRRGGEIVPFGPIIDPAALINEIRD